MGELTTIILRFRDLVTAPGQTIQQHKDISDKEEHVWWGWWSKFGETVPDDAFRELARQAGTGGVEIFLMDSGQDLLYRATCIEIRRDPDHARIDSPDKRRTPEYYSKQAFLAWFRLKDVAPVLDPKSVLAQYSYVQVDEFFADRLSRFTAFSGKQVYSVQELRQQDRTIWFLRQFEAGDPTHEISLHDSYSIAPQHFPRDYYQTDSRELLWVSDLHFSEGEHHAFPLVGSEQSNRFNLGQQIERVLTDNGIARIGGVIISGDISWKAAPEEFEMAKAFIRRLATWSPLRADQIAVVPGNHDLKFTDNPADKEGPVDAARPDAREAYSNFYQDLFFIAPNEFLSCGRRLLMGRAVAVEIVCLNSSSLQQVKNAFQGHGFIGQDQLVNAREQIGWGEDSSAPRAYRIVVLHHHLLPTTFSEEPAKNRTYSVALDAEALVRWIVKHRVNLVLHGHMHQPFCASVKRPANVHQPGKEEEWHEFHVIGMGSTGVSEEDLGETKSNTIGILRFDSGALAVSVWSIHPTNPGSRLWEINLPLTR